MYFLSFLGKVG